jgi:hypothetical protein
MRGFLTTLVAAILLGPAVSPLGAAHHKNWKPPDLNKIHKQQRKALKQQQHAMKKVMAQHGMSSDQRRRFEHEMKAERQTLRKAQESESRRMKESSKSARHIQTVS